MFRSRGTTRAFSSQIRSNLHLLERLCLPWSIFSQPEFPAFKSAGLLGFYDNLETPDDVTPFGLAAPVSSYRFNR